MTSLSDASQRLHIVHVITDLHTGGAETMLYKLLAKMDRQRFSAEVVSLSSGGDVRQMIETIDIPVRSLDMPASVAAAPAGLWQLRAILRAQPRAVVQSWMYHADLLGGLAARSCGLRVLWDLQAGHLEPSTTRRTTLLTIKLCAALSGRVPAQIICCGHTPRQIHINLGYDPDRIVVIPNGVDVSRFKPDSSARLEVRRELGLPDDARLIGMAARFDPQKDHRNLIQATGRLTGAHRIDAHVVLFGKDLTPGNQELAEVIRAAGYSLNIHLLGQRSDPARLLAACDLSCLSSAYGEGLPNAVLEAMACGVPCVVTDVGDSGWAVGDTGRVVPPRSPEVLAAALAELLSLPADERQRLGDAARARVSEHFEIGAIVDRYHALYEAVAAGRA
jgi:glycosyltransferase involved in cell wall biosynthesis